MLSILIPTYNYEINELVEEIQKQAVDLNISFEIIVVEDGSSNTLIAAENKKIENLQGCKYIYFEQNKGRTFTRSFLAERAKFDLLLFLDADVFPKEKTFLRNFNLLNPSVDVTFGGIAYQSKKPSNAHILRWKYGKSREAKSVEEREKMPYLSIISQCILIKKDVFLKANDFLGNVYGVDVLFCQNLEKMQVNVLHIENPIIHLGLENNVSFIRKTKKAMKSIYQFEQENKIPEDYRPIQKAYQALKKNGALKLYIRIGDFFEKSIYKNLTSNSPSLFLFDLYRLHYYAKLQSKP